MIKLYWVGFIVFLTLGIFLVINIPIKKLMKGVIFPTIIFGTSFNFIKLIDYHKLTNFNFVKMIFWVLITFILFSIIFNIKETIQK